MITGTKIETTKSAKTRKALKDTSSPHLPDTQTSFMAPPRKARKNKKKIQDFGL
jgi:hypothetical protein